MKNYDSNNSGNNNDNSGNNNELNHNRETSEKTDWYHKKLPFLCQELYCRYCINFEEGIFEQFYKSTVHVFLSFAGFRFFYISKSKTLFPVKSLRGFFFLIRNFAQPS